MTIEKIHASLINNQRHRMVEQINQYGIYQFWQAYKEFLADGYFNETMLAFIILYTVMSL